MKAFPNHIILPKILNYIVTSYLPQFDQEWKKGKQMGMGVFHKKLKKGTFISSSKSPTTP